MKRKVTAGILCMILALGMLPGCNAQKGSGTDSNGIKAGTLTMLNSSEEDYGKFQDISLSIIESIEEGKDPEEIKEGILKADGNSEMADMKKTEFVYYDDLTSMIMGLNSGEIDAVQLYSSVGRYICSNNTSLQMKDLYEETVKEETKEAIDTFFSDGFSFMLAETNGELRDELNRAIEDMKKDGTLNRLEKEYIENVIKGEKPEAVEMDKIDGAETVKVAITGDLPPFDYVSPDGNPGGFNTAVLAEVGRRIGKNIELLSIDSGARAIALSSGKVDVVFWNRNSVEGIPPEGTIPDGEDPEGVTEAPEDRPELPPDFNGDGMGQALDKYKRRDMPDGTIVTIPYFTDHYVLLTKK